MEIETGYLYHIKDEFFNKINEKGLMINQENGHSRPSYLAIKDKDILWFIPLSTKVDKYKSIIEKKVKKFGTCKTILIKKIAERGITSLIGTVHPENKYSVNNFKKAGYNTVTIFKVFYGERLFEYKPVAIKEYEDTPTNGKAR